MIKEGHEQKRIDLKKVQKMAQAKINMPKSGWMCLQMKNKRRK